MVWRVIGSPDLNAGAALVSGGADALTLGFGDELEGGLAAANAALQGQDAGAAYNQTVNEARDRLERARRTHPGWTFAGDVAGSLIPGTGIVKGLRAAGAGARAALYGGAALQGGAYGAGSGENAQERLMGAVTEAPLAVAGAGVGEGIGGVAALIGRGGQKPAERAARLAFRGLRNARTSQGVLERRLMAQGATPAAARRQAAAIIERGDAPEMDPDDLTRWANQLPKQGGPVTEMAAEAAPTWANTTRAVANVDGPGQGIVKTALDARREGLGGRMLDQAQTTFSPTKVSSSFSTPKATRAAPGDYYDFLEGLRGFREAGRIQDFAEAYKEPVDQRVWEEVIKPQLVGNEEMLDAAREGAKIARAQYSGFRGMREQAALGGRNEDWKALDWTIGDVEKSVKQLEMIAAGEKMPPNVNTRTLEYLHQGIWQRVERAGGKATPVGGARAQQWGGWKAMIESFAPKLDTAQANFGRSMRVDEMAQKGRKVFDLPDGEIDTLLRGANNGKGVTLEEGDAFIVGAMEAIDQKLGQGDTAFVARLIKNKNWQRQLERSVIRPGLAPAEKRAAQRRLTAFMSRLNREVAGQEFNNFVQSGSRTTPLQQDIRSLTDGESELGFVSDLVRDSNFRPEVIATKGLSRIYDRMKRPGIYDPRVNKELAQLMTQPATAQNMTALATRLRAAGRSAIDTPQAQRLRQLMGVLGAGTTLHAVAG